MSVFRIHKDKNYTVMSNYHLRDQSLKISTIGVLSIMLSLPENWDYTVKGLASITSAGIDAIRSALKDLEAHGYLYRTRTRCQNGTYKDIEYNIYECPQNNPHYTPNHDDEKPEKPMLENPTLDKPMSDKTTQKNKDKPNKDSNNKRYINQSPSTMESEPAQVRKQIQESIGYNQLSKLGIDMTIIDRYITLMADIICHGPERIKIRGKTIPKAQISSLFMDYKQEYILFAYDSLQNHMKVNIRNPEGYVLATLYSAPQSIHSSDSRLKLKYKRANGFSDFEQRVYDYDQLEEQLLSKQY